jgi:hypothetical protein
MRMRNVCGEGRIAINCSNLQHWAQHMRKPTPQQGFPAGRLPGIFFSIIWFTHENTFQKSVPYTGLKFDGTDTFGFATKS